MFALEETSFLFTLVYVPAQGFIYNGEEGRNSLNLNSRPSHAQRAFPVLISPLVGAGITGPAVVETSTLVIGDKNTEKLSARKDTDAGRLEDPASHLQAQ